MKEFGDTDSYGRIVLKNKEFDSYIVVGVPAIRHGLTRAYETNVRIATIPLMAKK